MKEPDGLSSEGSDRGGPPLLRLHRGLFLSVTAAAEGNDGGRFMPDLCKSVLNQTTASMDGAD